MTKFNPIFKSAAAGVEVQVHKVNSKGNSLKDMFSEMFKENPEFFKSHTKH